MLRKAAGINDPRNVTGLFDYVGKVTGGDSETTFRTLMEAGFDEVQADYLTSTLGTKEGLDKFKSDAANQAEVMGQVEMLGGLSEKEKGAWATGGGAEGGGMAALGKMNVAPGEWRGVKLESAQMQVGQYVAQGMVDSTDAMINLAKTFQNLLGMDLGKLFTDVTGAIKTATEAMNKMSGASGPRGAIKESIETGVIGKVVDAVSGLGGGGTIHGVPIQQWNMFTPEQRRIGMAAEQEGGGGP
jgi:hypothetical protein